MIKDSGNRTEFESGAVRDIQEGKGRCDLLPLDIVAEFLDDPVLYEICFFQESGNTIHLFDALWKFLKKTDWVNGSTLILEVAKHFEEGAKKYGDRNWEKGMPTERYIDSAIRHYLKFRRGDKDESHDRACAFNLMACIWTCRHHPQLNCYPIKKEVDADGSE